MGVEKLRLVGEEPPDEDVDRAMGAMVVKTGPFAEGLREVDAIQGGKKTRLELELQQN